MSCLINICRQRSDNGLSSLVSGVSSRLVRPSPAWLQEEREDELDAEKKKLLREVRRGAADIQALEATVKSRDEQLQRLRWVVDDDAHAVTLRATFLVPRLGLSNA